MPTYSNHLSHEKDYSFFCKNFSFRKKFNFLLMLLFLFGASISANAHAVQTAWCFDPNDDDVRNGPGQDVDCGAGATININGGAATVYNH
jgi:hypothetical protein